MSNCEFVAFPLLSWVRCGTWLYRFLIFASLLTLNIFFLYFVYIIHIKRYKLSEKIMDHDIQWCVKSLYSKWSLKIAYHTKPIQESVLSRSHQIREGSLWKTRKSSKVNTVGYQHVLMWRGARLVLVATSHDPLHFLSCIQLSILRDSRGGYTIYDLVLSYEIDWTVSSH